MSTHGGKRKGAGRKSGSKNPNAGRKKRRFIFSEDNYILDREMIGGIPEKPQLWRLAGVHENYIELERVIDGTSEIITLTKQSFWNGDS